ncbi:methyltransferase domain-containing protein [Ktedonosporobacter rubrisoli]|uniref:Methyltransferase domain-containing protein n=1 Tax=Ktedonosporobacter rubrisoli TaxID=2509675 RepID=A0A4P6K4N7_KTERU|nr:class I SAM-dependent methyltransferase [Ktedonosporobacter rubrisoli]QBD82893.1 methyltransferase domain-containing protein [Ktedonosporobacter rubrisoli]
MSIKPIHPDELFNGYVGANVAYALQQIGLFSVLTPNSKLKPHEIAVRTGSDLPRLQALLKACQELGYISSHTDGSVSLSTMGEVLHGQLGYFTWSVGGYGDLLRNLGSLTRGKETWKPLRNEGMVALGADMNHHSFMEHILFEVLDHLSFHKIADFGCGNGGRLISFCQRYPHIKGVGIDISADAIKLAEDNVKQNNLEDRLEMICTNVLETIKTDRYKEVLAGVDLVSSFMMLHDLYNIPSVWPRLFDHLREAFPGVKHFLFADTVKMPSTEELSELPIFSVGYELLHSYMDVCLPTKAEYDAMFARAGLTIEICADFGTPYTYLYLLRV